MHDNLHATLIAASVFLVLAVFMAAYPGDPIRYVDRPVITSIYVGTHVLMASFLVLAIFLGLRDYDHLSTLGHFPDILALTITAAVIEGLAFIERVARTETFGKLMKKIGHEIQSMTTESYW